MPKLEPKISTLATLINLICPVWTLWKSFTQRFFLRVLTEAPTVFHCKHFSFLKKFSLVPRKIKSYELWLMVTLLSVGSSSGRNRLNGLTKRNETKHFLLLPKKSFFFKNFGYFENGEELVSALTAEGWLR